MRLAEARKLLRGAFNNFRHPGMRSGFGGPFNGQIRRQQLFQALCHEFGFERIVETGTFRGTTTEHMARVSGRPVLSAETDAGAYGFARARFLMRPDVRLFRMDSRVFLVRLHGERLVPPGCSFFYLDAHWGEDLPLGEEVSLIFSFWPEAVVMIDDFEVPGDSEYGFDDYGQGKKLCLDDLMKTAAGWRFAFYPSAPASLESGARRGCVLLVSEPAVAKRMAMLSTLRAVVVNEVDPRKGAQVPD